ncbi:DNA polymerase subunit Cdc27 [Entophlyctis helioformis]|nr:DNA polymerase subunit Cdc27 [Entophlyctis helioformis]
MALCSHLADGLGFCRHAGTDLTFGSLCGSMEVLESRVLDAKQIATLKWLSRGLAIDTNTAERLLSDFVQARPGGDVCALFQVHGEREDGSRVCKLVPAEQIEAAKAQLVRSSVHVHSVHPARALSVEAAFRVDHNVLQHDTFDTMRKLRLIQSPDIKAVTTDQVRATSSMSGIANAETKSAATRKSMSADPVLIQNAGDPKSAPAGLTDVQARKAPVKSASFFSKYNSKGASKGTAAPPVKPESTAVNPKPAEDACPAADSDSDGEVIVKRRTLNQQAATLKPASMPASVASSTVASPSEQPEKASDRGPPTKAASAPAKPMSVQSAVSRQQSALLSRMFEDDDADDQEQEQLKKPAEVPAAAQQESNSSKADWSTTGPAKTAKHIQVLSDSDEDEDCSRGQAMDAAEQPEPSKPMVDESCVTDADMQVDEPQVHDAQPRRVRKRRRVKRSKTFMDGKYMKTVDVSDWESYSEDETVHQPPAHRKMPLAPKAAPPKPSGLDTASSSLETDGDHDTAGDASGMQPAAKSSASKGKRKGGPAEGQKTLFSFFGKKP